MIVKLMNIQKLTVLMKPTNACLITIPKIPPAISKTMPIEIMTVKNEHL